MRKQLNKAIIPRNRIPKSCKLSPMIIYGKDNKTIVYIRKNCENGYAQ